MTTYVNTLGLTNVILDFVSENSNAINSLDPEDDADMAELGDIAESWVLENNQLDWTLPFSDYGFEFNNGGIVMNTPEPDDGYCLGN